MEREEEEEEEVKRSRLHAKINRRYCCLLMMKTELPLNAVARQH